MDGPLVASLWSRFSKGRSDEWEQAVVDEIERATAGSPPDVTITIPALQVELGKRLEFASGRMKEKGYRLRQVVPHSGVTWAASFMRVD